MVAHAQAHNGQADQRLNTATHNHMTICHNNVCKLRTPVPTWTKSTIETRVLAPYYQRESNLSTQDHTPWAGKETLSHCGKTCTPACSSRPDKTPCSLNLLSCLVQTAWLYMQHSLNLPCRMPCSCVHPVSLSHMQQHHKVNVIQACPPLLHPIVIIIIKSATGLMEDSSCRQSAGLPARPQHRLQPYQLWLLLPPHPLHCFLKTYLMLTTAAIWGGRTKGFFSKPPQCLI